MRLNRCPACGAACSDTAEWCTLCYAELRPTPPTVEVAPPAAAPDAGFTDPHPLPGASPSPVPVPEPLADPPILTAAAATAVVAPEPRWPCTACGALMPMPEPACTVCDSPFLRDPVGVPLGGLAAMPPARRALLMVVGSLLLMGVFLLLALIVGSLL